MRLRVLFLGIIFFIFGLEQAYSQVRIGSEESDKLVIEKTEPTYPAFAKMLKLQDTVKVEATISEAGEVISTKVMSGNPAFKMAALEAAKKRKYKPYVVDGKSVPFITTIEFLFSLGISKDEYEREQKISERFFKEEDKCRNLVRSQNWKEAESVCKAAIKLAEQFSSGRELEKMGAYELFGHVLSGQKRYPEALEYYNRALDAVRSKLTEKDAELGRLYGDIAIAYHLLRDLSKAREMYRKAEKIYQLAHASIGDGDSDEWIDNTKRSYKKALKRLLEYHLLAAEDAGAMSEIEEIKRLTKGLP